MDARILFISKDIVQKGLMKEIETYLRVNRNMNITFDIAGDEDAGLNRVSNLRYDLIILDFDILEVAPMQILKKIKESSKAVIMVLTSDVSEETGILALENGADDIQYKPLRQIEFLLKVSNLVRMRVYQDRLVEEKGILKQFVSEEIADHVMSETSATGIKTYATVLFFDIRNSTALAETVSPLELAEHFNKVMNLVIDIIYKNMGSVNNILGDGILATFGYPVVYDLDVVRAVRCIYEIRRNFQIEEFAMPVGYGIGVTTGAMFSGNIGNSHKMTCTVLGDTVNTASRLQNMTKKAHVDALIDQTTYQTVEKYVKVKKYQAKVRGKAGLVNMYFPEHVDIDLIDLDLQSANEVINSNISDIGEVEFF